MFTYSVNLTLIWAVGVYMVRAFMGLHSAAGASEPENREQEVEHLVGTRAGILSVSYTHLRAHETGRNLVCRLLLEKKK